MMGGARGSGGELSCASGAAEVSVSHERRVASGKREANYEITGLEECGRSTVKEKHRIRRGMENECTECETAFCTYCGRRTFSEAC